MVSWTTVLSAVAALSVMGRATESSTTETYTIFHRVIDALDSKDATPWYPRALIHVPKSLAQADDVQYEGITSNLEFPADPKNKLYQIKAVPRTKTAEDEEASFMSYTKLVRTHSLTPSVNFVSRTMARRCQTPSKSTCRTCLRHRRPLHGSRTWRTSLSRMCRWTRMRARSLRRTRRTIRHRLLPSCVYLCLRWPQGRSMHRYLLDPALSSPKTPSRPTRKTRRRTARRNLRSPRTLSSSFDSTGCISCR